MTKEVDAILAQVERRVDDMGHAARVVASAVADVHRLQERLKLLVGIELALPRNSVPPNPRQLTLHMGDGNQLEFDLRTPQG